MRGNGKHADNYNNRTITGPGYPRDFASCIDELGGEPAELDIESISGFLENKTVLVTGAGGSVGRELIAMLLRFNPSLVLALDNDETELFYLHAEFAEHNVDYILADVTDYARLDNLLECYAVDIILHGAAYKHVPVLEHFPEEAVRVNIGGTRNVITLADQHWVSTVVLISTDKAALPSSIMGASKQVAEQLISRFHRNSGTHFLAVRFGNILGSRGSVVPLFEQQIARGGPVTITDPGMRRYMVAGSDAAGLILQAAAMPECEPLAVLDAGTCYSIPELAGQIIRLHGYEPEQDIAIRYTGRRAGEKLVEVLYEEVETAPTRHPAVKLLQEPELPPFHEWQSQIDRLQQKAEATDRDGIRNLFKQLVPGFTGTEYTPNQFTSGEDIT